MKNSHRIFLIFLSIMVALTVGSMAIADEPTVGVCGNPTTVIPVSRSFGAGEEGTGGFTVPIPECFWSPNPSADSWITVNEYHWLQSSVGTLNYTVAANDQSGPRDGSIFVNGYEVHTIHQDGACEIVFIPGPDPLSTPAVFVSNTACERIVEVTGDWSKLYSEDGSTYEGLVYGPNHTLYALDPTRHLITDLSDPQNPVHTGSSSNPPLKPREAVFNHRGDLIVVDSSVTQGGLYFFENLGSLSAIPIPGSAGIGVLMDVTTAANGDLLVADSAGMIRRFPFNALSPTPPYGPPSDIITGIVAPTTVARSSNEVVFVGDGTFLRKYKYDAALGRYADDGSVDFGADQPSRMSSSAR